MSWIKRNLFFLTGSLVALALMAMAGWFLWSNWQLNNDNMEKLNAAYARLDELNKQSPHPGSGKVDNDKVAKAQRKELHDYLQKTRPYFQRILPIPDLRKVTDRDFSPALSRTIAQLQRDATNASVALPPDYSFSFDAQKQKVSFAAGSLEPLSVQLGEIKTICDILFQAKVNALDSLRRERVSLDDQQASSQAEYLEQKSTTNDLAVLSPYEIVIRCFSAELASVLSGFASSHNGIVVKSINVESAPASAEPTPEGQPVITMPQPIAPRPPTFQPRADDAMNRRYGLRPGGADRYGPQPGADRYGPQPGARGYGPRPLMPVPQPVPVPAQPTPGAVAARSGVQIVLDEKLLKVTIALVVVKPLPSK
jgi:hypothetical protein